MLTALANTINLSGTVQSNVAVTSSEAPGASDIDLGGRGTALENTIVKVADLALSTNNAGGLTLSVTSGNMTNVTATTPIAYQVTTVDAAGAAPIPGAFLIASGIPYTVSTSEAGQIDKDLYIRYSTVELQDPGTHTATITLTATDN